MTRSWQTPSTLNPYCPVPMNSFSTAARHVCYNFSTNKRRSNKILGLLQRFESRNVTFIESDGSWPIVWDRATGVHIWDVDGRKYRDLTAAFGVAATGHANPRVVRAGQRQMG